MMRIILLALLSTLPIISFGQVKSLDEEYKFGPFKFGQDLSRWEDKLKGTMQISFGQDYYLYTEQDQEIFYNLKVWQVNLGFYKDKLNYVDYYFRKLDDFAFDALLEQVSTDYGIPDKIIDPDDKSIIETYLWREEKVMLQLIRYSKDANDWDDRNMTVLAMELMF